MMVFVPKNGAALDVDGLYSISQIPDHLLKSLSFLRWGSQEGGILSGLEPNGRRFPKSGPKSGPSWMMVFSLQEFVLSAGSAIVPTKQGRVLVTFHESQLVQFNAPNKGSSKRALVLKMIVHDMQVQGEVIAATQMTPEMMLINQQDVDLSTMVVLANELSADEVKGQVWSVDIQRCVAPQSPLIQHLMQHLDDLEDVIWNSDRHGQPWNVQRLGREWKTYQSKASVAVTAARMALSSQPSHTKDRVRCLTNLHWQLQRSVEQAGTALTKWMWSVEYADRYAPVFSAAPIDWDEL